MCATKIELPQIAAIFGAILIFRAFPRIRPRYLPHTEQCCNSFSSYFLGVAAIRRIFAAIIADPCPRRWRTPPPRGCGNAPWGGIRGVSAAQATGGRFLRVCGCGNWCETSPRRKPNCRRRSETPDHTFFAPRKTASRRTLRRSNRNMVSGCKRSRPACQSRSQPPPFDRLRTGQIHRPQIQQAQDRPWSPVERPLPRQGSFPRPIPYRGSCRHPASFGGPCSPADPVLVEGSGPQPVPAQPPQKSPKLTFTNNINVLDRISASPHYVTTYTCIQPNGAIGRISLTACS
jgi:hypothetical protein